MFVELPVGDGVLAALLNSTQLPHEDEMDDLSDPFRMPVSGARGSVLPNGFGDKVCNWFILVKCIIDGWLILQAVVPRTRLIPKYIPDGRKLHKEETTTIPAEDLFSDSEVPPHSLGAKEDKQVPQERKYFVIKFISLSVKIVFLFQCLRWPCSRGSIQH